MSILKVDTINEKTSGNGVAIPGHVVQVQSTLITGTTAVSSNTYGDIMSLAITFGSTVILDIMLTPMIISAGPILIGLGVDYSLHLTNRIEENRTNILKSRASSRTSSKQTFDEDSISYEDPFNPEISLKSTVMAIMTTGNAILLSALTTMIGFILMYIGGFMTDVKDGWMLAIFALMVFIIALGGALWGVLRCCQGCVHLMRRCVPGGNSSDEEKADVDIRTLFS